jgi:hypothetical protein
MDNKMWQELVLWSTMEETSVSELIRTSVKAHMKSKRSNKKKLTPQAAMLKYMAEAYELGPSNGPADFAKNHDKYLY